MGRWFGWGVGVWFFCLCLAARAQGPQRPLRSSPVHSPQNPTISSHTEVLVSLPLGVLRQLGFRAEETHAGDGLFRLSLAQVQALKAQGVPVQPRAFGVPVAPEYLTPEEIDAEMTRLATKFPNQCEIVDLNQRWKIPKTHEGRSLKALRIRAALGDKARLPIVLLDSLHHSRELITPMITMDAARTLLENPQNHPEVRAWLQRYEIWIVPIVNPDGYAHVWTKNPLWRKNRRPHGLEKYGVDINRNYPYLWGACGTNSANGSSEVYRGAGPASEPEAQAMMALGKELKPFIYLTYHSYGDQVVRPFVCRTAAEASLIHAVATELFQATGYKDRVASSSGESFEHFYSQFGSFSLLIEVGKSFQPAPTEIEGLVGTARKTWMSLMQRGLRSALFLKALDDTDERPVLASVSIDEIVFQAGEQRMTGPDGALHWLLSEGDYTLKISAKGYQAQTLKLTVSAKPLELNIRMRREQNDDAEPGVSVEKEGRMERAAADERGLDGGGMDVGVERRNDVQKSEGRGREWGRQRPDTVVQKDSRELAGKGCGCEAGRGEGAVVGWLWCCLLFFWGLSRGVFGRWGFFVG